MEFTWRSKICVHWLSQVYKLTGDIIELGCNSGLITIPMARFLKRKKSNKKIHSYDCFNGLPYDGGEFDSEFLKKGEIHSTYADFCTNIKRYGVYDKVNSNIGLVENTLEKFDKDRKICFLWFDMDLYEPTLYGVRKLKNQVIKDGIIGFHDYGFDQCPGIKKVVKDELNPNMFDIIHLHETCAFFRKIK